MSHCIKNNKSVKLVQCKKLVYADTIQAN